MKFILQHGQIHIVDNQGMPNNNVEGVVETPGLSPKKIECSINNQGFKELKNKVLVIKKNDLNRPFLNLEFRVQTEGGFQYYKSDAIPLTHAVFFGGTMEDFYPQVIKDTLKRVDYLERHFAKSLKKNESYTKEEIKEMKADLEQNSGFLKDTMKQIVDTFEEINKKGSLF